VNRYTLYLIFWLCVFSAFATVGTTKSFALDPRFELDTKLLGPKNQVTPQAVAPPSKEHGDAGISLRPKLHNISSKTPKGPQSSSGVKKPTSANNKRNLKKIALEQPSKSLGKSQPSSKPADLNNGKRAQESATESSPTLAPSPRLSSGNVGTIQWARDVWEHIFQSDSHATGPLFIQGRNFSLSLDSNRYPMIPAADGGKIVIDTEMTLSPLVKTILLEKAPGVRIVSDNPADRKSFFSSLLKAAKFYSVEENFSVDFGSDPKLTVNSDFKIEKTSKSLIENDVLLVSVTGKSMGMPPQLLSFLDEAGFHMINAFPDLSEVQASHKVLYVIQGRSRDTIVDQLFFALSTPCEKEKFIVLDDGFQSGVSLSVMADRFSESNNRKIVISFSDEDPVQYTLLRLLELKGFQVVILSPEDDFKKISEKVLSSLGLPEHYGMHPLWLEDDTPFNVQLSGFVLAGAGPNDAHRFLTNVPIDPLVGELARYKGFDVIVK